MRRLLVIALFLCGSLAYGASFAITAVRVDGTGTATRTGTATVAAGTLTSSAGATFAVGDVGSGIIFNSIVCYITAFTSSTIVTVSSPCANATAQAYTILTSACYNPGSCNGWVAEFDMSASVGAGGTYSLGMTKAANFNPSTAKVVFTCTSSGYTSAGGSTTYSRTIYGTRQLRQVYPNYQTNDEVNATVMTLRIALSDPIFSTDTCTVTVAAGIYTDGSANTNSLLSAGAVTNNSTLTFASARVIGNWSRVVNWQRYTGATIPLAAVAFQHFAQNNRPVAAVVFTVADAHAHSNSVTVTVPTIDPTQGDGPTYNVTGSVTSGTFTAGEKLKQTNTGALAFLVTKPTGSQTAVISTPLGPTHNSHTWVGQSSSAVYTPTSTPTLNPGLTNVIEYIANVPTTGFNQGDLLSINFKAYPWIGDSNAVMDTSDGTNVEPTPLYTTKHAIWDGSVTYGTAVGVVDPSQTIAGSVTSGTFIVGEKVTQSTSAAVAYTNNAPTGSTSLIIGATVSGTPNATNGSTWTGATSGAVFTQTGGPAAVGSDSNSCAVAESTYTPGTTPGGGACKTINGAAVKMAAFNNANYSRNDVGGTMYLKQGGYNWTGAAVAVSNTTANVWATLTPFQGVSQAQVVIQTNNGTDLQSFGSQCTSGTTSCGTPIHLKNLTINIPTNPVSIFNNITYLWIDNSVTCMSATAAIYQVTITYFTQGAIPCVSTPGLAPFGGVTMSIPLIRGVDLTGNLGTVMWFTILGTVNLSTTTQMGVTNETNNQPVLSTQPIWAYNGWWRMFPSGLTPITGLYTTTGIFGAAVVQNVIESNFTDEVLGLSGVSADSSTATPVNNVMFWHNAFVGGRINRGYNESGNVPLYKATWGDIGNLMDLDAMKTDTFAGTAAGARVGNWSVIYGVGRHSSLTAELTGGSVGWQATQDFRLEFPGTNTYEVAWSGTNANGTSTTNPIQSAGNSTINFFSYNNRSAFDGTNPNTGFGDYRVKSNSNAINFIPNTQAVLPYDFAGIVRDNSGHGAAGPYEQTYIPQVFLTF